MPWFCRSYIHAIANSVDFNRSTQVFWYKWWYLPGKDSTCQVAPFSKERNFPFFSSTCLNWCNSRSSEISTLRVSKTGWAALGNDYRGKLGGGFLKWRYPQITHFNRFNRVFHYEPSILGYHYSWKHPGDYNLKLRDLPSNPVRNFPSNPTCRKNSKSRLPRLVWSTGLQGYRWNPTLKTIVSTIFATKSHGRRSKE